MCIRLDIVLRTIFLQSDDTKYTFSLGQFYFVCDSVAQGGGNFSYSHSADEYVSVHVA